MSQAYTRLGLRGIFLNSNLCKDFKRTMHKNSTQIRMGFKKQQKRLFRLRSIIRFRWKPCLRIRQLNLIREQIEWLKPVPVFFTIERSMI